MRKGLLENTFTKLLISMLGLELAYMSEEEGGERRGTFQFGDCGRLVKC